MKFKAKLLSLTLIFLISSSLIYFLQSQTILVSIQDKSLVKFRLVDYNSTIAFQSNQSFYRIIVNKSSIRFYENQTFYYEYIVKSNSSWAELTINEQGNLFNLTIAAPLNSNSTISLNLTWSQVYVTCNASQWNYVFDDASDNLTVWAIHGSAVNYVVQQQAVEDVSPPKYSDVGVNSTEAGEPCEFSSYWTDDVGLSGFVFSTNLTGNWRNDSFTALSGVSSWANVTKQLPNALVKVAFKWYCNDTSDNWNETVIYVIVVSDSKPPTYSNVDNSTNIAGVQCTFSSLWEDNLELSGYIFSHNNSGTWLNETFTSLTGSSSWANFTLTLNKTVGVHVGYKFYCNDTSDNWNETAVKYVELIDPLPPEYSNVAYSTDIANKTCKFMSLWRDNVALSGFIFSHNNTGAWINETWIDLNGDEDWAVFYLTLNSTIGVKVGFKFYCNDSLNNWASTNIVYLTVKAPPKPKPLSERAKAPAMVYAAMFPLLAMIFIFTAMYKGVEYVKPETVVEKIIFLGIGLTVGIIFTFVALYIAGLI